MRPRRRGPFRSPCPDALPTAPWGGGSIPPSEVINGTPAGPNAEVAVAVDAERFWSLFLDVLATYP